MKELIFIILSFFGYNPETREEAELIYLDVPVIEFQVNTDNQITSVTLEPEEVHFERDPLQDLYLDCINNGWEWSVETSSCVQERFNPENQCWGTGGVWVGKCFYPEKCMTSAQCQVIINRGGMADQETMEIEHYYLVHNYNAPSLAFVSTELFGKPITNTQIVNKGSLSNQIQTNAGKTYLQTCTFPVGVNERLIIWEV